MKGILFILLLSLQVPAQEISIIKGGIIDSIKVSDSLPETFSLFVPREYEPETAWPALFIFDPKGRGLSAARLFREAAARQGYLLISSNDLDPEKDLVENVKTAVRLINKALQLFHIDQDQMAVAGSMLGGKVATSIPLLYEDILGTLAVGKHWVNFNGLDLDNGFSFIAIIGDEQYTGMGMKATAALLEKFKFPTQVYTYEGADEWPGPELIGSALGALTLEAMRQELRPKDAALVEELYNHDMTRINQYLEQMQWVQAFSFLEVMEKKFSGLRSTSEIENKLKELDKTAGYQRQVRERQDLLEKENRLLNDFVFYLKEDISTANFENLGWWNFQKLELDSLAAKGGAEAKMGIRLQHMITEFTRLQLAELKENRRTLEKRLVGNIILTLFDPTNFEGYKEIISLGAQDNDYGTALFYLEEMLKHGYEDLDGLYEIEGTLGLRLTPEYNHLIEKYLGRSKYYDN